MSEKSALTHDPAFAARWPECDYQMIERIAGCGDGLVDLWEASPVRLETNEPHSDQITETLFPGDPLLCCGWSRHRFDTRPKSRWYKLDCLQFIVPSPMTALLGVTKNVKKSPHALSNTGSRRFLVVEFDFEHDRSAAEAHLLSQAKRDRRDSSDLCAGLLLHLAERAPLALAVHSGGKSLHGWFYCAGQSEESLARFMNCAVSLGADPATWIRSQFVRMPDGLRDNGKRQSVFFFNPSVMK